MIGFFGGEGGLFCFLKMGDTNTYLHIDGLDPVAGKKFVIQESKGYKLQDCISRTMFQSTMKHL